MTTPSPYDTYTSPLATRNASPEMLRLWSARHKFNTWRKIWLAVAEAQHEIGLGHVASGGTGGPPVRSGHDQPVTGGTPVPPETTRRELVTREQVDELRAVVNRPGGITDEEMKAAERYERELRHDVMAHVHALGDSCPKAKGIIHLGMTSQDVVCNADRFVLGESLGLTALKCVRLVLSFGMLAEATRSTPTLAFTHYQAAQPVTVGRRVAVWGYDISLCLARLQNTSRMNRPRGLKGATGTQASFLALVKGANTDRSSRFNLESGNVIDDLETQGMRGLSWSQWGEWAGSDPGGDYPSWDHLEDRPHSITGQTYPRVIDTFILADLASVASVLHKIATDIRLLCNRKELDEPFEDKQIGSSAMPYKRNPMRCERICGLTRFVMNLVGNAYDTAATQWLERTLDDSSNRRLSLPEAFLALDGALDLMHNVASGLVVYEATIRKNLMAELPFMATENILMACVKLGADRQEYHEVIRQHAQAAGHRVKQEGLENDLLERLQADKRFWSTSRGGPLAAELDWSDVLDPMKYVGRSVEQTERFIKDVVEPLREQYGEAIGKLSSGGPRV